MTASGKELPHVRTASDPEPQVNSGDAVVHDHFGLVLWGQLPIANAETHVLWYDIRISDVCKIESKI